MSQNTIETDAKEFGLHVKQGGWRLGLLVARNVEKGTRGGDNGNQHTGGISQSRNGKVPAKKFADDSGTSADRVLRYLTAWNKAADAGLVPHSTDLTPGQELDGIDFEALNWNAYYTGAAGPFRIKDESRREALIRMAENDGVGAGKVQEIAANPNALVAAIKADPQTAEAAANALAYTAPHIRQHAARRLVTSMDAAERLTVRDDIDRASRGTNTSARLTSAEEREEAARKSRGGIRAAVADGHLIGAKRKIREAIAEIHEADLSADDRDTLRERVSEVARMLDLFRAEVDGKTGVDWDAELASMMGGE